MRDNPKWNKAGQVGKSLGGRIISAIRIQFGSGMHFKNFWALSIYFHYFVGISLMNIEMFPRKLTVALDVYLVNIAMQNGLYSSSSKPTFMEVSLFCSACPIMGASRRSRWTGCLLCRRSLVQAALLSDSDCLLSVPSPASNGYLA